ncbi:MAG: hypothetical protein IJC54_07755 [Clostridia bacterium]|nr:hypothetical protein [Clostridia bacterium]
MALWDEFGKKAGETARNFGARAKEVAETTKLNGQIAIKKTEAERLYGEIGKAFFAIRAGRTQESDELEQLCAQVEKLDEEIAQLQKQIDVIRQVRRCKNCGEVSPNTSRYCGACGAKFEEEQPPVVAAEPAQEEPSAEPVVEAEDGVEITWPQAEEPAQSEQPKEEE